MLLPAWLLLVAVVAPPAASATAPLEPTVEWSSSGTANTVDTLWGVEKENATSDNESDIAPPRGSHLRENAVRNNESGRAPPGIPPLEKDLWHNSTRGNELKSVPLGSDLQENSTSDNESGRAFPKSEALTNAPPKSQATHSALPRSEVSGSVPPKSEASESAYPRSEASHSAPSRIEASESASPRSEVLGNAPTRSEIESVSRGSVPPGSVPPGSVSPGSAPPAGVSCTLVPSDLLWYFCGEQQLKIKDGVLMEVVCDFPGKSPLDCSPLPARPAGPLERLEVTDCSLPPRLELACVGGSAAELTLRQAPSSLTADNVRGLDAEDVFIMARPGAVREIPLDAIRALPRLKRFRLLQGTNITLEPEMFPPSPLQRLEVSMSGIRRLPRAVFTHLRHLTSLSLFKNDIRHVDDDAFEGLESLSSLVLDGNPLERLPPRALRRAPRLRALYLQRGGLTTLDEGVFEGLTHLEQVTISSDAVLSLGARAFSALPSLASVTLTHSRVASLPEDLFLHSDAVVNLTLSHNNISRLPAPLWSNLTALRRLDLSHNMISTLTARTFSHLRALEHLDLSGNLLTDLPELVFSGLRKLTSVSLAHNRLSEISAVSLVGADSLVRLSLSHNRLGWSRRADVMYDEWVDGESSPLNMLLRLQELDLSYNNISIIFSDWRLVLRSLASLDLSHNALTELSQADMQFLSSGSAPVAVDVSHNNITAVQPRPPWDSLADAAPPGTPAAVFTVGNNPFHCDCMLYDFITQVQAHVPKYIADDALCSSPAELAGVSLARVPPAAVSCPLRDAPAGCGCLIRAHYRRVECDCLQLDDVPDISSTGLSRLSLRLRAAPREWRRLPALVTSLTLSDLSLTHAPDIPAHVTHIDLTHNQIKTVTDDILQRNLTLKLESNPLDCDCFATDNVKLLQKYAFKILDYDRLKCSDDSLVKQKDAATLCDVYKSYVSGSLIAFILILIAFIIALMYIYKVEIQVILYRKKWCLFLLPKEKDDSDKKYDVFVSFAHEDEKFVLTEILPSLTEYKLHVQGRDWEVGGTIPEQIHKSVELSKRTLIILSQNFTNSRWATEEFRTVHAQAINDKRTRCVVVLLDVKRKELDKETKTFLSLSTFIKYNESLFWDRLRFALPKKDLYKSEASNNMNRTVFNNNEQVLDMWKNKALDVVRTDEGKLINMAYVKDIC